MMLFWNFFTAWIRVRWFKLFDFEVLASPEHQKHRDSMCESCDFYRDGLCEACGCLTMSKTMLNSEKCPKGRWNRIYRRKLTKKQKRETSS